MPPSIKPSSSWLALHKSRPRKFRKVDRDEPNVSSSKTSAFPRNSSLKRNDPDGPNEHVDLATTEVKNGESIAVLRRMVLGKVEYNASQTAAGKYLALDCEMVGIGIEGSESSLARVSIVNYTGAVVLDVFVRQRERVVDYRTQWSGIRSTDLGGLAKPFKEVQQTVGDLIKDRVLVGHAVYNDLKALLLSHPSPQLRDTQSLAYKHRVIKARRPALRVLVKQELGIAIQGGEHSSVTDARATMALFRLHKKQWESGFRPFRTLPRAPPNSELDDNLKGTVVACAQSSSPSTPIRRGRKRKRSELSKSDDGEEAAKALRSSSAPRTLSPVRGPQTRSPVQHTSVLPHHRNQKNGSNPRIDSARRKGFSSGLSTVIRRVDGMKEVMKRSGGKKSSVVGGSSKSERKTEEWWKTLGGGKKSSIKL